MGIEQETEEKIFRAAQTVFQQKGFDGARMQEIADEAEINKSMLHYYYRSKDNLFLQVFQAGVKKIMPQLFGILASEKELKEKVHAVVNFYHDMYGENPHLPSFVIYEMNQHPERFKEFIASMHIQLPQIFIKQVQDAVAEGIVKPINAHQFLINMVSLCMMPMIARRMVQTLFTMEDAAYKTFLEERRSLIPNMILNGGS